MDKLNVLVDDMDDIDVASGEDSASYEIWAIGYDEEGERTDVEMQLGTFADPDEAVAFAKQTDLADIVELAAEDEYDGFDKTIHTISVEVETVVQDADMGAVNSGTIYKKQIELFEDVPDYVVLGEYDYEISAEDGLMLVHRSILNKYNVNDDFVAVFEDVEVPTPIPYKIVSERADNYGDYFACELIL